MRDPRIENWVPRISEKYHRVPRIRENRVPRIREIASLQVHTGYLTFSLKKIWYKFCCNEKSCSMLKSLFLEEFAVLHLNMAGFLEVVQRSHSGGSLILHMWDQ